MRHRQTTFLGRANPVSVALVSLLVWGSASAASAQSEAESPSTDDAVATEDEAASAGTSDDNAPSDASAASIQLSQEDRIRAVSRKVFLKRRRFEIEPFLGASTNDAFFQHWTAGARLSYHLFDSFSFDVGGAYNFVTLDLPSVEVVKRQNLAIPDEAILFGLVDAGVTFAPIYGKFAVLDEWIVHFDGFVSGGLGATFDSNRYSLVGLELPEFVPGVNPAAQVGIGGRVFLTDWLVVRGDVRDYFYPQTRSGISTLQSLLFFNIGLSIYFPFSFEYEYVAAKVVEG